MFPTRMTRSLAVAGLVAATVVGPAMAQPYSRTTTRYTNPYVTRTSQSYVRALAQAGAARGHGEIAVGADQQLLPLSLKPPRFLAGFLALTLENGAHRGDRVGVGRTLVRPIPFHPREPERHPAGIARALLHVVEG